MDLEIITKINKAIENCSQIAVILPENLTLDELCSAMALANYLRQSNKTAKIFSSSAHIPALEFLHDALPVYSNFGNSSEFTIKINANNAKPKQLRYEKENDDLLIYITPESGRITEQDVELLPAAGEFDLFIMIGVTNFEVLGRLYQDSSELFYQTTKIAISNKIDQEYFAAITWVDPTSSSISEQIALWLDADSKINNEFIATSLLAGIIDQTQSFRDPKTTPHTLDIASRLVKHGAKQQDIIQHLFKTKPFALLQVWGRAMARVKVSEDEKLLYTVISKQDFDKTQTAPEILPNVLRELVSMANTYQLVVLAAELTQGVQILLAAPPHVKLKSLVRLVNADVNVVIEPLVGNYNYVNFVDTNYNLEDIDKIVSILSTSGI